MSEVEENKITEKAENSVESAKRPNGTVVVDSLLRYLCYLAIVSRLQIPLTLQVGGLVISGILIDRRKYNNGMNPLMRDVAGDSDIPGEMKRIFGELADEIFPITDLSIPDDNQEEIDIENVNFIHLKDARIVYAQSSIPTGDQGFFWRAPLSAVDGFTWGTISIERK